MDSLIIGSFLQDPQSVPIGIKLLLTAGAIWAISWKGFALYHAARQEQKLWFVAVLFINTVGLLEIAYLFYFAKNKITLADLNSYLKKAQGMRNQKFKALSKKK